MEIAQSGPNGTTALTNNNVQVRAGGSFQLTGTSAGGITYGNQDDSVQTTPYVNIYSGASLLGSGTASLVGTDLEVAFGQTSGTVAALASGDVLTLSNAVKSYGAVANWSASSGTLIPNTTSTSTSAVQAGSSCKPATTPWG